MPSTVTHSYFSMDVYEKLPLNRKIFLKDQKQNLKIFSQSMDPLNFYITLNFKKSKKVRSFANYFHSHKTNEFFINTINYIKYNYYKDNPQILAFLYGTIMHYVLDSTMHPYICYKTGHFEKKDKNTYKYNNKHHFFETAIDQYMIMLREKTKPRYYKHYREIILSEKMCCELSEVIDFTFKETFNIKNFSNEYNLSIKRMKLAFKVLRYDKYGLKSKFYNIIDTITPKSTFKLGFLSYGNIFFNKDFLNLNNKSWYNPTSKKIKSNKSFNTLYIEALNNCLSIIKQVDSYIYDNKDVDLNSIFKNKSYSTGIELKRPQKMKYFEY
ncbi:MAG: zinc dependent phospholipase C family protein [bacterium]|nr:zinc dependent phospholipase C family protein [bacterium]